MIGETLFNFLMIQNRFFTRSFIKSEKQNSSVSFSFHRVRVTFALSVETVRKRIVTKRVTSFSVQYLQLIVLSFGYCWINRVSVVRSWKNGVTCVLVGRGNRIFDAACKSATANEENQYELAFLSSLRYFSRVFELYDVTRSKKYIAQPAQLKSLLNYASNEENCFKQNISCQCFAVFCIF